MNMTSLGKISRTLSNNNLQITYPSGNIKRLPVSQRKKYEDAPDKACFTIRFTEEGLRNTQTHYKKLQGIPRFIHDILHKKPSQHKDALFKRREQYELFKVGKEYFFIVPNISYMSFEDRIKDPKNVKNTEQGVALCAWYIPEPDIDAPVAQALLNEDLYEILRKEYQEIHDKDPQALRYGESGSAEREKIEYSQSLRKTYSVSQEIERLSTQKSISEIEQETGERYLTTILDLTQNDIPMLQALQKKVYAHLKEVYDVDPVQDDVRLSFHFPHTTDTVTLHLHARTGATHPLDDGRSFELGEIIEELNSGKTMSNMILAKKSVGENLLGAYLRTAYWDEWYNSLGNIKGVTFAPAKNPKLLSSLPYHYVYQRRTKPPAKVEATPSAPNVKDEDIPLADAPKLLNEFPYHYVYQRRTKPLVTAASTSLKRKEADFTPSTPLKNQRKRRKRSLS